MRPSAVRQRSRTAREIDALHVAVRRSLRLSTGIVATSLAVFPASAAADAFPPVMRLPALYRGDGIEGVVLRNRAPSYDTAYVVGAAGDVNGDGFGDVVLGGRGTDANRASYVVFGGPDLPAVIRLASLATGDGSAGFALRAAESSTFAASVSTAGDVNGDGVDDFILGSPYTSQVRAIDVGRSFVVFGRDAGQGETFPHFLQLDSLRPVGGGDGSEGFVIEGFDYCATAGASVSAAGDVNGDGIEDLVVGAPDYNSGACYLRSVPGKALVIFGRESFPAEVDTADLFAANGGDGSEGFVAIGSEPFDGTGGGEAAVSGAGDVNGDGIDDVVIGSFFADCCGFGRQGRSFVVFGRDAAQGGFPAEIELAGLLPDQGGDGSTGFVITGIGSYDRTGKAVSDAGDVNGDGIDDLLIGSLSAAQAYVVFGRDTAQQGNFPAEIRLTVLLPPVGDGSIGFVLEGVGGYGADAGEAVSKAGDVNADGIADLIIGAPGSSFINQYAGAAYVVFGRDTAQQGDFPAVLPLAFLHPPTGDGTAGFVAVGVTSNSLAGQYLGDAGDTNGDGVADIIVSSAGEAYIVFGRAPATP